MVLTLTLEDLICITIIILFILVSLYVLKKVKKREKDMNTVIKAKKDMLDLEAITKNLENNYRPINIELTSYEKEQEESAVISYEELVSKRGQEEVSYDESYVNNSDVDIKKVDLKDRLKSNNLENTTKINLRMFDCEAEEAFLKALKQLQNNLAR